MRSVINLHNGDCMDALAKMQDNEFDLAIVDPPYGISINKQSQGKGGGVAKKTNYTKKDWDSKPPSKYYFKELNRVCKNVIIWGANHFIENIPNANSSCWIVWNKDNGATDFADSELAYTNFQTPVRNYKCKWSGMLQYDMKNKEKRIHPTQKPIRLYEWILMNYAKEGDKILDTHLGSGSIAIACHNLGYDLEGYELDEEYYNAAVKRYNDHIAQLKMF